MSQTERQFQYQESTQTLVGTKRKHLQDLETGEVIEVDNVVKRVYGAKQFWKVYLADFLQILGILDSRQVDILIYIIENAQQADNMFIGTYRKIAEDTGTSTQTVNRIMKKLLEHKFLYRRQTGVYYINPNILMKGNDNKRQMLLTYCKETEPKNAEQLTLEDTEQADACDTEKEKRAG